MRVLIAYDGSDGAAQAVAWCQAVDWPAGSLIRVVGVMEPAMLQVLPWAMGTAPPHLEGDVVATIEVGLANVVSRLSGPDRVVDSVLLRDRPASGLVDHAREFGADLVILGSRGHGPIVSLVLGSVSAEVADHAPCPVLIARRSTLERVLFANDGSPTAAAAEDVLARWPIFTSVPIRVLSVADIMRPWTTGIAPTMYAQVLKAYAEDVDEAEAEHRKVALGSAQRLREAGRTADSETRTGDAAAEIIACARASSADLVVVGSRGQTGLKRIVLGSVARNVLMGSDASVLIIHQPDLA